MMLAATHDGRPNLSSHQHASLNRASWRGRWRARRGIHQRANALLIAHFHHLLGSIDRRGELWPKAFCRHVYWPHQQLVGVIGNVCRAASLIDVMSSFGVVCRGDNRARFI